MELITVSEAAQRAGVRREAIYYSIKHGKLTGHREYGNTLIDAGELVKYRPRAHASRSEGKWPLGGRGRFAALLTPVDEFIARGDAEKARER